MIKLPHRYNKVRTAFPANDALSVNEVQVSSASPTMLRENGISVVHSPYGNFSLTSNANVGFKKELL